MQPRQPENVDGNNLLPVGASDITKRVGQFRSRKASKGLERLEIYTSRLVKDQVKEFALVNRLTRGVAAEVLLQLGIAAHLSQTHDLSEVAQAADAPLPVVTDAPPTASSKPIPEMARLFAERTHPNRPPQSIEKLLEPSLKVVTDAPPLASGPIHELARLFAERTHPNSQPQSVEQLFGPSFDAVSDIQMSTESTASEQMHPKLEPKDHPIARLIRRESGP